MLMKEITNGEDCREENIVFVYILSGQTKVHPLFLFPFILVLIFLVKFNVNVPTKHLWPYITIVCRDRCVFCTVYVCLVCLGQCIWITCERSNSLWFYGSNSSRLVWASQLFYRNLSAAGSSSSWITTNLSDTICRPLRFTWTHKSEGSGLKVTVKERNGTQHRTECASSSPLFILFQSISEWITAAFLQSLELWQSLKETRM